MCPRSSLPSARAQSSVPSAPSNVKAAGSCREGHAVFAEASLPWVLEQRSASVRPGSGEGPAGVCHHRVSPGRQGTALVAVVLRKASARPSAPPAHPRSPPRLFHDDREARLFPGHRTRRGPRSRHPQPSRRRIRRPVSPPGSAVCEDRCPRSLLEDAAAHWRDQRTPEHHLVPSPGATREKLKPGDGVGLLTQLSSLSLPHLAGAFLCCPVCGGHPTAGRIFAPTPE
ncbi:uncharacterized protein LOC144303588 [Canis aureus]